MSTVQQIGQNGAFGSLTTGTLSTPGSLTTKSITFPTAGGTPTPLADYEEYTDPNFTLFFATGFQTTSATTTLKIVRVGKLVVFKLAPVTALGNGGTLNAPWGSAANSIPSRFTRASGGQTFHCIPILNGTTSTSGTLLLNNSFNFLSIGNGFFNGNWGATVNNQSYGLPYAFAWYTILN